jgi:hypothetical protein
MSALSDLWADAVGAYTHIRIEELEPDDLRDLTWKTIAKFDERLKSDVLIKAWGYAPGTNGKVRIAGGCSTVCAPLRQALTTLLLRPLRGESYVCKTWVAKNYEVEDATDEDLAIAASAPDPAELQALSRFIYGVPGPTLATLATEVMGADLWVAPKYADGWTKFLYAIGIGIPQQSDAARAAALPDEPLRLAA